MKMVPMQMGDIDQNQFLLLPNLQQALKAFRPWKIPPRPPIARPKQPGVTKKRNLFKPNFTTAMAMNQKRSINLLLTSIHLSDALLFKS
jgi:hypothetical protein